MRPSRLIPTLAPACLFAVACTADLPTNPASVDSSLLVTAQAGKKGPTSQFVMEPRRIVQRAQWDAGYIRDFNKPSTGWTYRVCQLNPLEDLDGNDFWSAHADGFIEEQVKEQDAFVLILEGSSMSEARFGPTHVYVGRAVWNASEWYQWGANTTINSNAQGVAAPLRIDSQDVSADATMLLESFRGGWAPGNAGDMYDLERTLLTPDAPTAALVTTILEDTPEEKLRGVECDWQESYGRTKENTITYSFTWPKHLERLFR